MQSHITHVRVTDPYLSQFLEKKARAMSEENEKMPRAVIVGGSIAGLSCAHALILAGWHVTVLEKSLGPPAGSPTGAGLGLDPLSLRLIKTWTKQPDLLQMTTLPLTIDQNQIIEKKQSRRLTRDEGFGFRAAYWPDLHGLLCSSLPPDVFLWGHVFVSLCVSDDRRSVKVKAKAVGTEDFVEVVGDLLVAADGSLSSIRRNFLPQLKLRYAGYCAWRGILDFSDTENSDTMKEIREAYTDLGNCLYFELANGTHIVMYELLRNKLNWIWYINQPEPQLEGNSVTVKPSNDAIKEMQREAERTWAPALARAIGETKEPFVNVIYDSDPLERLVWDRVVLVGDAAHPSTPHGLRSTNMSLLDAAVLGACLTRWRSGGLGLALTEYESVRLPVVSAQVLHSRRMGRVKQGLVGDSEGCEEMKQRNMPFFGDVPSVVKEFYGW